MKITPFLYNRCKKLALLFGALTLCSYFTIVSPVTADPNERLLTTTWAQGPYPYNSLCPSFAFDLKNPNNVQQAPAGCVAIAMAQIINYWGQNTGYPSHGYNDHYDPYFYGGGLQGFIFQP